MPPSASLSVLGLVPIGGITSSSNSTESSVLSADIPIFITGSSGSQLAVSTPAIYNIEVGAKGQLVFSPNYINAAVGSVINLIFRGLNHIIIESSLEQSYLSAQQFNSDFTLYNPADIMDL